jgi:hypothetical protein
MNPERVNAYNLVQSANVGVSEEEVNKLRENMNKCALLRLLESTDPDEVRHFVDRLMECLSRAKKFPPPTEKVDRHVYEQTDITRVAETVASVKASGDTVAMKVILLAGLRTSAMFVQIFCPPPSPTMDRRFLVDPDVMQAFTTGLNNPLQTHMTAFLVGRAATPEMLVTACLTSWMELGPWHDADRWSKLEANAPSVEMRAVAKRIKMAEGGRAVDDDQARLTGGDHEALLLDF